MQGKMNWPSGGEHLGNPLWPLRGALRSDIGQGRGPHVEREDQVQMVTRYVEPISPDLGCLDALELFLRSDRLTALPVVERNGYPLGLINRQRMIEQFSRPFARELNQRKRAADFVSRQTLCAERDSHLDELVERIGSIERPDLLTGFVVTDQGRYHGLGTLHELLHHITRRKQAHLYQLAHFDALTRLPNRLLFSERLEQVVADAAQREQRLAVMFLDLDGFKFINDTLGHAAGDHLLCEVSERLAEALRPSDTLARLGGDEFTLILSDVCDRAEVQRIASGLLGVIAQPVAWKGQSMQVTGSLGVALYPDDDSTPSQLVRKADLAMYQAKGHGKDNCQFFSNELNRRYELRRSLEQDLGRALGGDELFLHYQPVVGVQDGRIHAAEALLRWNHPEHGLLLPDSFIAVAEEGHQIEPVSRWTLERACRQLATWASQGVRATLTVNLSMQQFHSPRLCHQIGALLEAYHLAPDQLMLEITERVVMHSSERVIRTLQELKRLGVQVALDDFGTGHSSLALLHKLPIDFIKIDRTFIQQIGLSHSSEKVTHAILALADSLGLRTVAEGVEHESQLDLLRSEGCHCYQGHLFSPAIDADTLLPLLRGSA